MAGIVAKLAAIESELQEWGGEAFKVGDLAAADAARAVLTGIAAVKKSALPGAAPARAVAEADDADEAGARFRVNNETIYKTVDAAAGPYTHAMRRDELFAALQWIATRAAPFRNADLEKHLRLPSHKGYIVIWWIESLGQLKNEGRGRFSVIDPTKLLDHARAGWQRLAEGK